MKVVAYVVMKVVVNVLVNVVVAEFKQAERLKSRKRRPVVDRLNGG